MRTTQDIRAEIDGASQNLESNLTELKETVRHEVDPSLNAARVIDLGERKARELYELAKAEILAMVREVQHTARHEGWRAAFEEAVGLLKAALRDLRAAIPHSPSVAPSIESR